MSMSIPYELTGRTHQKARTRNALIGAARELLAEGVTPTVERTADRAGISRTTAFRYFPNQRALLVATYPQIEEQSLLGAEAPDDPIARLEAVPRIYAPSPGVRAGAARPTAPVARTRPQPDGLPLRQGRGIGWIEEALRPLREVIPERELHRLVLAIRATLGIEALVWLTDVAESPARKPSTSCARQPAPYCERQSPTPAQPDRQGAHHAAVLSYA